MKNLRYIFLITTVIIGAFTAPKISAQPNTLSYMKGIPQTKDINPALYGLENGFYISMPGISKIDIAISTSGFVYNDIIHSGTGQYSDSLIVDFDSFYSSLSERNFLRETLSYSPIEFGFKAGNQFFGLSLSIKESASFFFGKNLVGLIKDGNAPYIGQQFDSGNFGINGQSYFEAAFNYGREINDQLTMGIAVKGLFGLASINSKDLHLELFTPTDGTYIDMSATGDIYFSAPIDVYYDNANHFDSISSDFDPMDALLNFSNSGFAIDFGATYQLTDKLQLSASIIDIGLISWKTDTYKFNQNGTFLYSGIDLSNSLDNNSSSYEDPGDLFNNLGDSIIDAFDLTVSEETFSTYLPTKVYLGADYELTKYLSLGGLARLRYGNSKINYAFTSSANLKLGRALNFTLSHSVINKKANIMGAGLGLRGGPLQMYIVSDNLLSAVNPAKTSNVNLRFGINFIFGDKKDKVVLKYPN